MNELAFHFLPPEEMPVLAERPAAREVYLDALMFLHDAICEFSLEGFRPTFSYHIVEKELAELQKSASDLDSGLHENIKFNTYVANGLRKRALQMRNEWRGEPWNESVLFVTRFVHHVVRAYQFVIAMPWQEQELEGREEEEREEEED